MSTPKTNAMRMLDKTGINYKVHSYNPDAGTDGIQVAAQIGQSTNSVFKTLVTQGDDRQVYVFVIPMDREIDLKAAARSVGAKSIQMAPHKDLLALTGYMKGGCSPVGMKKRYPTVIDRSAGELTTMIVSAGKIGLQVELAPSDLLAVTGAAYGDMVTPAS